jgi:hypothetical protein
MVRSLLDGRFENTAFCLLAPDGKERLSRGGRSPWMAFSRKGPRGVGAGDLEEVTVAAMERVAKAYKPQRDLTTPVVQDFHSFRQALNVAAGDQRLLLYVLAPAVAQRQIRKKLSKVMGDPEIVGRFHIDFIGQKGDEQWASTISGVKSNVAKSKAESAMFVIQSGQFGQTGSVLKQLSADATAKEIKYSLLSANESFAKQEERKVYSEHVAKGRREGVYFEGGVEYGEDRNGNGKIDHVSSRRRL